MSVFQLKNSNISNIDENIIIQTYQSNDFKWIYIERIYKTQKSTKYNNAYITANGKIGTWYGIGVNGCV